MSFSFGKKCTSCVCTIFISLVLQVIAIGAYSQMRQVHVDLTKHTYDLKRISFCSPSEGYIAFSDYVAFTPDSGKSFIKRYVTNNNVNYNGYSVLSASFRVAGAKALSRDTVLVYGDYYFHPSILYSTDQGLTFKLVYFGEPEAALQTLGITAIEFPENNNIGFATEAHRILKTTDRGKTWVPAYNLNNSFLDVIDVVNKDILFAFSTSAAGKIVRSTNGGVNWAPITSLFGQYSLVYYSFISATKGWASAEGDVYYTSDGGTTWTKKNVIPFSSLKINFLNDSTGYAISEFTVYKTSDSGKIWEPLSRDNNFGKTLTNSRHSELSFWNENQFWAGGSDEFIELTTNAGGIPLPKAFFKIDTTGLSATKIVHLINYSKPNRQYKWIKNDILISTSYNASYTHDIYKGADTIQLVVTNGSYSDTLTAYQYFNVPPPPKVPAIASFTPAIGTTGTTITINGENFTGTTSVTIGGTPASSFTVVSDNKITAVVAAGSSGSISVTNADGTAERAGFTFFLPPTITSFNPTVGLVNEVITIKGTHFIGATIVRFGGTAAASFTIVSDTEISAVLAVGASGDVTVITPGGTATLAGFVFHYAPKINNVSPLNRGGAGDTIIITGSYFTGAIAVSFGGVPAAFFRVDSDNRITAVLGNGADGTVLVTTPYGTGFSGLFDFVPPPTITSFTPTSGGLETSVLITGTDFFYTKGISIGGIPVKSYIVGNNTRLIAKVSTGATGKISVTTSYGATNSASDFTWYPAPAIYSYTPTTATAGSTIIITGLNFNGTQDVKIGGASVSSFTINSNTSITATVPLAQSGDIMVQGYGGKAVLSGFVFIPSPSPIISSFTPDSGPIGTTVIITGQNFNPDATGNIVYFGGVKAAVTQATNTTLTVTVPYGATYKPISVTTYQLTSYTNKPFTITFPGEATFKSNTFVKILDSVAGHLVFSGSVYHADLDGDDKPDVFTMGGQGISIYRNTSSNGTISLQARQDLQPDIYCDGMGDIGDIDGDGRLDIAIPDFATSKSIKILRNISTSGAILFDTIVGFADNGTAKQIAIRDLNEDGKPDLVVTTWSGANVSHIYKNTSRGAIISFDRVNASNVSITGQPKGLFINDMDGDGKPDIIMGRGGVVDDDPSVVIFRNTSSGENISFEPYKLYPGGHSTNNVSVSDLDGDGKPDIVTMSYDSCTILKNMCTPGALSFVENTMIPLPNNHFSHATIGDLNGDGKPDIVFTEEEASDSIAVFNNTSIVGSISFGPKVRYYIGLTPMIVTTGDLDGDGKPEITVVSDTEPALMSILKNNITAATSTTLQLCSETDTVLNAGVTGTTYQWQQNIGSGFAAITDNTNFSGTNTAVLHLTNIPATWNGYQYRCVANNTTNSITFNLTINSSVHPGIIISGTTTLNEGQSTTLTAAITNGGTTPSYQWQDSTKTHTWQNITTAIANTLLYTPAATGDKARCMFTSNAACASTSNISSSPLQFTVTKVTGINPVPAADYGVVFYPNPVGSTLIVDSLRIGDQWQTIEISGMDGRQKLITNSIINQRKVVVKLDILPHGMYVAILRRKSGAMVYYKFIKL